MPALPRIDPRVFSKGRLKVPHRPRHQRRPASAPLRVQALVIRPSVRRELMMPSQNLLLSTDNPYKSLRLISILIDVGILPKIPPLSDHLTHVHLDLLQPVDVHLHTWPVDLVQVAQDLLDRLVQVGLAILVLHVRHRHVDLVLGREVNAVVVLRDLVGDLHAADY